MIDYHSTLVSALKTIGLPVHYEMVLHSGLATPCISYMENNNYVDSNGDTLGYSWIGYQIKVWGNDIATIQQYALQVDNVLRSIGFKRTSTNELHDPNSTMIQKIMSFEGLAYEQF